MPVEDAKSKNDLANITKFEDEKQWINSELTKACGPGGRVRKLADER
jgi:hypothetical protein